MNLLVAILLVVGLLFGFLWMLGFITNHGEYEKVPNVKRKTLQEAIALLEEKGFKVEVADSMYIDTMPPLAIVKQSPEYDMMVKAGRTIYVTVNRTQPPMVEVPNMTGFSFRNAEMYLKQLGLKLGDTTRRPNIAKDAVLEVLYNGRIIKSGTKIFQGSTISFVLGSGLGEDEFPVPEVYGMTYAEAKSYLASLGLDVGGLVVDPDVRDTANAYVNKQYPERITKIDDGQGSYIIQKNNMREGQAMDLWLGRNKVERKTEEDDSSSTDDYSDEKPAEKKKEKPVDKSTKDYR